MTMTIPKRNLIGAVLALILLGALLGREYPMTGLVTVAVAMGGYVLFNLRRVYRGIKGWGTADWNVRGGVLIVLAVCIWLVELLLTGKPTYFPVLLLLGADLLIK